VVAESWPAGFAALYPVLRAMEESGRIRRGYFIEGWAARSSLCPARWIGCVRTGISGGSVVALAATDQPTRSGALALAAIGRSDGPDRGRVLSCWTAVS